MNWTTSSCPFSWKLPCITTPTPQDHETVLEDNRLKSPWITASHYDLQNRFLFWNTSLVRPIHQLRIWHKILRLESLTANQLGCAHLLRHGSRCSCKSGCRRSAQPVPRLLAKCKPLQFDCQRIELRRTGINPWQDTCQRLSRGSADNRF